VIRAPVSRGQLRAEVERRLPFDAEVAISVPATTRNWNTITAIRKVLMREPTYWSRTSWPQEQPRIRVEAISQIAWTAISLITRDTADAGCRKEEAFEAPGGARLSCASVREAGDVYTV
jgi:hypothetical protein